MTTRKQDIAGRSPRRRWSRLKIAVVGLCAIAATGAMVLGAVYFALIKKADATLAEAVAEADRLDPGWRLEDINTTREKEVIPPEQDASARVIRVLALTPDLVPPPTQPGIPPRQAPIVELHDSFKNYPPQMVLGVDFHAALAEMIKRNEPALKEARSLCDLTRGKYKIDHPVNPLETLLPNTQKSRDVLRLLDLDALLRAERRDGDGTLEDLRAMLGVADSIDDEPTAVSQLVRIAEISAAIKTLERVLAQGEASDQALSRVQKRLHDEGKVPFNLIAMRAERAISSDLLGKLADGTISPTELDGAAPTTMSSLVLRSPHGRAFFRYNQGLSIKAMNKAVEISKLPIHEQPRAWGVWREEMKPPYDKWGFVTGALTYLLIPALGSVAEAQIRVDALIGCGEIMVAMERFRIANGRWPESIEAIPKSILPEIPLDPFTGKPLRILRKETTWAVYSVGPNGKDDGGALDPRFDPRNEFADWGYNLFDPSERRRPPFYEQELPSQPFLGEPLLDGSTVLSPDTIMDSIE